MVLRSILGSMTPLLRIHHHYKHKLYFAGSTHYPFTQATIRNGPPLLPSIFMGNANT